MTNQRFTLSSYFILFCALWAVVVTGLVSVLVWPNPIMRAVLCMADGLLILWILIGGSLMYLVRDKVRRHVRALSWNWRLKFILFCTLLALLEEAVTVTMTNCAPLFGVEIGQAYITASANYIDVVCYHSVIVFIPMFVCWAFILSRYDFHPNHVLILFGCTGILAEATSFDPNSIFNFGFWILVYGLMIYLPVYSLPANRPLRKPRWYHYPLAVIVPPLCVAPVALIVNWLHPVTIHFPPVQP